MLMLVPLQATSVVKIAPVFGASGATKALVVASISSATLAKAIKAMREFKILDFWEREGLGAKCFTNRIYFRISRSESVLKSSPDILPARNKRCLLGKLMTPVKSKTYQYT